MGAAPKHIDKYTAAYRRLFPRSPILLLRSEPDHFLRPAKARENVARPGAAVLDRYAADPAAFASAGDADIDGVLARLREARVAEKDDGEQGENYGHGGENSKQGGEEGKSGSTKETARPMLVHLWSNGGSGSFAAVRALTRHVPRYTVLFDSAPGQFHFRSTLTAFGLTVPTPWVRRLLAPLLFAMVAYFWARVRLRPLFGGGAGPLRAAADSHNDPSLLGTEIRRTYVYSDEDELVPAPDVEAHAAQAKEAGFDVRLEKFSGAHVAHARADPDRYWRVVRETWYGPDAKVVADAQGTESARTSETADTGKTETEPVTEARA